MSYRKVFYLIFFLLILCGGCGLKEGVVQKEPMSFLWFSGNTQNAIAYIDDLAPIILSELRNSVSGEDENSTNKSGQVHYEISPGKHTIVVKKSGEEVVNRKVLLGQGITKEIKIP